MNPLTHGTVFLKQQGIQTARRAARVLLAHVLACPTDALLTHTPPLTKEQSDRYQTLLARVAAGEPVTRVVGEREFWSLPFYLSSATLDPRPDSETLVQAVLNHIAEKQTPLRILDLGTGSGCLLLSLLHELSHATGVGVDISAAALSTAARNAARLGLTNRVHFQQSDWCHAINDPFDIVVSNPPYIPLDDFEALDHNVRNYDPKTALVAGKDGLDCYRAIAADVGRVLKRDGLLALEIGFGQAAAVKDLFKAFHHQETVCDLADIPRVILLKQPLL